MYSAVSLGGRGDPVNVTIQLYDWGQTKSPYQAFYGQVAASDIAQWGEQFRHRLFSKNIRAFLGGNTAVNEAIAESIRSIPSHFWYLNNGITALCGSINKRPIGGSSHDAGTFDCEHIAIVNGAQTVGALTELSSTAPEQLALARVPIRLISLEGCPPEFANDVTRATNTQNRVDSRNFVALDPEQARIRSELLVDGIDYEYRQGEGEPHSENSFGLVDATVALACSAATPDLAVQAKREISRLWDDLSRAPYKLMLNGSLQGLRLWHLVQILRAVEEYLDFERVWRDDQKIRSIAINGNRLIAHLVYSNLEINLIGKSEFNADNLDLYVDDLSLQALERVKSIIDEYYEDAYLAHLFKNLTKCRDVVSKVGKLSINQEEIDKVIGYRELQAVTDDDIPF